MAESLSPEAPNASALDLLKRRARRRLSGAIVLALAGAVALPLVLESDAPPLPDDVDVRIPPIDNARFTPKITAPVAPAPIQPIDPPAAPKPEPTPPSPAAPTPPAPAAPAPAPPPPPPPKPEPRPAVETKVKAVAGGKWVVQLAALRDANAASAELARVKKLGYPGFEEKITVANGVVTRVRVGPLADRESALSVQAKLVAAGFENAKAVDLK